MFVGELRPFQDPGADKFLARGSMLAAMDTGTGKTVVSIACAEELLGCEDIDLCVVVCPAGLKYQWARAIAQFTDIPKQRFVVKGETITIPRSPFGIVIDGNAQERLNQFSMVGANTDYVVMGYNNVIDDSRYVRRLKPGLVVLDEATAIKNPAATRTSTTKNILNAEYRLALTATPIENYPEELFSIMEWVDASVLGRWDFFDQTYIDRDSMGNVRGYDHLDVLRDRVAPAMFVASREDPEVAKYMPTPSMTDCTVRLDADTWKAYERMACQLLDELHALPPRARIDLAARYTGKQQDESTPVGKVMAMIQACERLLDHPVLVAKSAANYAESVKQRRNGVKRKVWKGSKYCYQVWKTGVLDTVMSAPKVAKLQTELAKILSDPESKVVIFSKYQEFLSVLDQALPYRCVKYDGRMNAESKEAAVAQFENDPQTRVFLSSHAGAYGRDLWMANWLINMDQPPSAGRADQINGRVIRASSKFDTVTIVNMICERTLEERNMARLEFKRSIGTAVLKGTGTKQGRIDNTVETLTRFLERTVG